MEVKKSSVGAELFQKRKNGVLKIKNWDFCSFGKGEVAVLVSPCHGRDTKISGEGEDGGENVSRKTVLSLPAVVKGRLLFLTAQKPPKKKSPGFKKKRGGRKEKKRGKK